MPVYRLTPVEGTEQSPQWFVSSIHPHCVWVQARDEYEARSVVARATAVGRAPAQPQTLAPWKDPELVSCEYDDSKDVAPGVIRIRSTPYVAAARQHEHRFIA